MAIIGNPRTFQKKFSFVVEIEGVAHAGFQKMSALEAEVARVEQWEGGTLIPDKSPGRVTVSDVTLERGVATNDGDLYVWFLDVVNMSAGVGNAGGTGFGFATPFYKRQVDLVQYDRTGLLLRRWTLNNAWPNKFVAGEWDNEADENVIEMVTLSFDTFDKFGS
jgi:phage tail-like protein